MYKLPALLVSSITTAEIHFKLMHSLTHPAKCPVRLTILGNGMGQGEKFHQSRMVGNIHGANGSLCYTGA